MNKAILFGALPVLFAAAGCVAPEPVSGGPCAVMTQSHDAATTIVLVDRSGSTRSDDPSAFVPDWASTVEPVLPISTEERYAVAPFAGDRSLAWPATTLAAPRFKGTKQSETRDRVRECVKHTIEQVALKPESKAGTDILGALHAAGAQYPPRPGQNRRIVLATDGWASRGCAKVRSHPITEEHVAEIVDSCQASDELPVNLHDASLTIVGIGTSSSKERIVLPGEIATLAGLWRQLCQQIAKTCVITTTAPTEDGGPSSAPRG